MINFSENNYLESIIALNMALCGNLEKNLTEQESERNISKNLVSICAINEIIPPSPGCPFNFKGSSGSGLMITSDGFIITAYHNIQAVEEDWKRICEEDPVTRENVSSWTTRMRDRYCTIDQTGNRYPIDISFFASLPDLDIALIKAITKKKPEPINFKVTTKPLQFGEEIKLLGLRDHNPYNQYGKVILGNSTAYMNNKETITHDTFLTDAYGVPGFSGGVFTDLRGGFAGLALYIQREGTKEIGKAGGAKVENIVKMVKESAYQLGKIQLGTKR